MGNPVFIPNDFSHILFGIFISGRSRWHLARSHCFHINSRTIKKASDEGARDVGWYAVALVDDLQAVAQAKLLVPNLVIMEVSMPNMHYQNHTRRGSAARILIMSQNDPAISHWQTLNADAHRFLTKDELPQDLLRTI